MEYSVLVSKRNKSQVRFSLFTTFILFIMLFMAGCLPGGLIEFTTDRASMKFPTETQPVMLGTMKKIRGYEVEHGELIKEFETINQEVRSQTGWTNIIDVNDNKVLIKKIIFKTFDIELLTIGANKKNERYGTRVVGNIYQSREVDTQDTHKNR